MWKLGDTAQKVISHPGKFALAVIKQFRSNQGVLLAGAVAYYTLLSLVPLLILVLMALSHIFAEDRLLKMLREYLEFVVPGQSSTLVEEVRTFLAHREVVGSVLLVTMLFFSALAFTVLENAISVIFFHRVSIKRRHFLVSAVMPYVFILFLGLGLLVVTLVSGLLQFVGTRNITILGESHSLGQLSVVLLYLVGVTGEALLLTAIYLVMPVGQLSLRHALIGGATATSSLGNHAPRPCVVLRDHVANAARLWVSNDLRSGTLERRVRGSGPASRSTGHSGIRAGGPRARGGFGRATANRGPSQLTKSEVLLPIASKRTTQRRGESRNKFAGNRRAPAPYHHL